jgi:hypothetical protein
MSSTAVLVPYTASPWYRALRNTLGILTDWPF